MLIKDLCNIQTIIRSIFVLFLLLFPLINYRLGLSSAIFPALDVIIIYYFSTNYHLGYFGIFLTGIFFDQIYGMQLGTNSTVFLLCALMLVYLSKWFSLTDYVINFLCFFGYCFVVFTCRYLIISHKLGDFIQYCDVVFQYFTTVFTYPLIKACFDTVSPHINKYAK